MFDWLVGLVGGWHTNEELKCPFCAEKIQNGITECPWCKESLGEKTKIIIVPKKQFKIRPQNFSDFVGNKDVVERLQLAVAAAKKENRPLPHILLYGNPGLGKTTLIGIVACAINAKVYEVTGSTIKSQSDLFKVLLHINEILTSGKNAILSIDEIHDINKAKDLPATAWYPLLEDFKFMHNLKGKNIAFNDTILSVQSNIAAMSRFTVIGATTDPGDMADALRERFPVTCILHAYTTEDLEKIIKYHSSIREIEIEDDGIHELALRARNNPRIAVNLLLSCRDRAVVGDTKITKEIVLQQMISQGIDDEGLTQDDMRVLKVLARYPKGLGLTNLAGACGIRKSTIEEMIEPFLKQKGYMMVTHKRFISPTGKIKILL